MATATGLQREETDSLRERKKRATRRALRRAAVSLVEQRGLAAVTVEDIAAAADVSPRTFFNYFATKEDAISGLDRALQEEMARRLRARPAQEPALAALRAVLLEALPELDIDHRGLLQRLSVTRSDPHLLAHHVSCWEEAERGLVAALADRRGTDASGDRYAALVVASTLSAARVALMSWCELDGRVALAEALAWHLDILAAGLAEPEAGLSEPEAGPSEPERVTL